jgi:ABC-2 type transport system ATP-binding protein
MEIIIADGLARTFRSGKSTVTAVRGVDLRIDRGEIVGFLGPNGAGKTTTLRMLTTLLRPTAGTARIAGADILTQPGAVRRRIGYVAQSASAGPKHRVDDEMLLQARLHRMDPAHARRRIAFLLSQFELAGLGNRTAGTLSGGQRRRLDVALGLVHEPAVIFLDEPTAGLDPQSRSNLWEHIRRLRDEQATTVFLTTHYLEEADALCDRILVIDDGRIIAEDTPAKLKQGVASSVVIVEVDGDVATGMAVLGRVAQIREVAAMDDRTLRMSVGEDDKTVIDAVTALRAAGLEVRSFSLTRPTLEDVFFSLTGRALRDGASVGQ